MYPRAKSEMTAGAYEWIRADRPHKKTISKLRPQRYLLGRSRLAHFPTPPVVLASTTHLLAVSSSYFAAMDGVGLLCSFGWSVVGGWVGTWYCYIRRWVVVNAQVHYLNSSKYDIIRRLLYFSGRYEYIRTEYSISSQKQRLFVTLENIFSFLLFFFCSCFGQVPSVQIHLSKANPLKPANRP